MSERRITFILEEPLPELLVPLQRAFTGANAIPVDSVSIIDSSLYLHDEARLLNEAELDAARAALVEDGIFTDPNWAKSYTSSGWDEEVVLRAAVKHGWSLAHLQSISAKGSAPILWTVADGTETTTASELRFITEELRRRELKVTWISPCTPARFEPAVEYTGDPEAFRSWLAAIPNGYPTGLMLPNANDKPALFAELGGRPDLVIALGLTRLAWLEALRFAARMEPPLFRDLLVGAQEHFAFDKGPHALSTGEDDIRSLPDVPDHDLEQTFLDDFRGRQLLHVTAHSLVENPNRREGIKRLVAANQSDLESCVRKAVNRHLEALGRK